MKTGFRKIALILAAALLCAALSACGGTSAPSGVDENTGNPKVAVSASAGETAGAAAEELPAEEAGAESSSQEAADAAAPEEEESSAGEDTALTAGTGETAAAAETAASADSASDGETAALTAETGETAEAAGEGTTEDPASAEEDAQISFDGESDLEYNARQILLADETITKEGALGVAAYLWQMGFGRMSGYPTIGVVNGGKILTVFDESGLFYNVLLSPEGKIQQVEDVEGNELISLGTRAGERVKPPISGADVVALLEEWKSHGGHSQVLSAYNEFAGSYGRSKMESDDQWCSETVSAAYAALGIADKIGGMASNGNTYEKNARSIGCWVSGGGYVPSAGDILITHDGSGERHTACVVSCDGHTIQTIAGGGSSIHHSSISVGSGRITGFVVPEW